MLLTGETDSIHTWLWRNHAKRVETFCGDVLNEEDLSRLKIRKAEAVFLLSNRFATDDLPNIFRALSLRKRAPRVRLFVELNKVKNRSRLTDKGVPKHQILCFDQLKCGIVAQNTICPGAGTLLLSLLSSFRDIDNCLSEKKANPSWLTAYAEGVRQDIFEIAVPPAYVGRPFFEIAHDIWHAKSAVLFGVWSKCADDGGNHVMLLTDDTGQRRANDSDVLVIIASLDDAAGFVSKRKQGQSARVASAAAVGGNTSAAAVGSNTSTASTNQKSVFHLRRCNTLHQIIGAAERLGAVQQGHSLPTGVEIGTQYDASSQTAVDINALRPPSDLCGHVVVVFAVGVVPKIGVTSTMCDEMLEEFALILNPLASARGESSIVLLTPWVPTRGAWAQNGLNERKGVFVIIGDTNEAESLVRAGAHTAARVVILNAESVSEPGDSRMELAMADRGPVLTTTICQSRAFLEANENLRLGLYTELFDDNNLSLLPSITLAPRQQSKTESKDGIVRKQSSFFFVREKHDPNGAARAPAYIASRRFAASLVISDVSLNAINALSYFRGTLISVMQALLYDPNIFVAPVSVRPILKAIGSECVTYGELVEHLIRNKDKAIPLGLYCAPRLNTMGNELPFVNTNPSKGFEVIAEDMLFTMCKMGASSLSGDVGIFNLE